MNLSQNRFLHDSEAHFLFEMMCDPTVEIPDFNIVDDDHLLLSSKKISKTLCDSGHTNVFLISLFHDMLGQVKIVRSIRYVTETPPLLGYRLGHKHMQKQGEPEPKTKFTSGISPMNYQKGIE